MLPDSGLDGFQGGDRVRYIPRCMHAFWTQGVSMRSALGLVAALSDILGRCSRVPT